MTIRNTQTSMKIEQSRWDKIFPKKEVTNVTDTRQNNPTKEISPNYKEAVREQSDSGESSET